jgi:hypothetical protein
MSMPILEELQRDVARHGSTYAAAYGRNPALAAYPTLDAVLAALRVQPGDKLSEDEARSTLVSALMVEAQRSRDPLWTSLLFTAFAPMLRRIRRQTIPCRGDTPEDVDQRVLGAFIEAVQKASPAHPAMGLRGATQRGAWTAREAELREERVEAPSASGLDEDGARVWFDGDSFEVQELEEPELGRVDEPFAEEDAMLERITARRIARDLEAKGQRGLTLALLSVGDDKDSLRAFVERTFHALPPRRRQREYQRLQTEQRRAVRKLRVRHGRDAA